MTTMHSSIQLANIDEELVRLWDREQGKNKIRASLFTLIICVQGAERAHIYQQLIKKVIAKFPCRIIFIVNDTTPSEEYLRTSVGSETVTSGELQIFCEIIQIEVAGSLIQRVPFIILPHILPDLPVYLLWTQDPSSESTILPHLEPLADRIIFDSQSTDNLQKFSHSVLSLMDRFHSTIGDLNWSAISGWRQIFMQVFDNPEAFQCLTQTNLIRIVYNKDHERLQKNPEVEAAYLQAWLASRLNWKFKEGLWDQKNVRLIYWRQQREVFIDLVPEESESQPAGTIISIEIESAKNKGHYTFKKHPQSRQVFIQYSEKDFCQLPYNCYLGGSASGQEIIEEIFNPSIVKHYKNMLETLAVIPWRSR